MRLRALLALLLAGLPVWAAAQELVPSQPVYRYLYDAKLLCGVVTHHDEESAILPAGAYATVVNLYNPHAAPLEVALRLALAYPPRAMQAGDVVEMAALTVPARHAVAVDCRTVEALHFAYGFPTPLIDGVLTADSLQPLEVWPVWSTATPAGKGHKKGARKLTSVDVDRLEPRLVEVVPSDPGWDPEAEPGEAFCDQMRRTSALITARAEAQSYTYDEAPGEGPREVTRLVDVAVLAGTGGVVGGPVSVRLDRGLLPDGRFVDTSEMPVLTVGERYLLMLPNYGWRIEPFPADSVLRIETVGPREILVDQNGFAVTGPRGERLPQPVSTPEFLFRDPEMLVDDVPAAALSVEDFAEALIAAADECEGPVLAGPYIAFPLVPAGGGG